MTVMMLLDLSSAYDTVDHDIMISSFIVVSLSKARGVEVVSLVSDRSFADVLCWRHRASCSVPQGSELGPVDFVAYTEYAADPFDRHKVDHHMCADDQQIYLHTEPGLASTRLTSLAACFSDLSDWSASRRLQLKRLSQLRLELDSRSIRYVHFEVPRKRAVFEACP